MEDNDIFNFINKLQNNFVEMQDLILYHGTKRIDFYDYFMSDVEKIIYFSIKEQQSEYHVFDDHCARDIYETNSEYPQVFKFYTKTAKKLKLLNLKLLCINNVHKHFLNNGELLFNEYDIPLFDFIKNLYSYTQDCTDTLTDCNKIIINTLNYLNDNYGTNYDGYYCSNDQDEISLILHNPSEIFNLSLNSVKFFDVISSYQFLLDFDTQDKYSYCNDNKDSYFNINEESLSLKDNYSSLDSEERYQDLIILFSDFCSYGGIHYLDFMMQNISDNINLFYTDYIQLDTNIIYYDFFYQIMINFDLFFN